jgi:predicted AlkP superfamily pyrophosphatase or phosphodiesterase
MLTRSTRRVAVALIATGLGVVGFVVNPPDGADEATSDTENAAALARGDDHIKAVLAISIDGLNPDAIRRLGRERAPNLHRLISEGVSTLNARTAVESTDTLPNHTGMLTSLRVDERRGGHGVDFNDDAARTTVHRSAGRYVSSIFDVVHDRGLRTALYTSKDKFKLFNRSWSSRHGKADTVGRDNGRDKIDRFTFRGNEDVLTDLLVDDLANGAAPFTFLHLSTTDKVGHERGYMSGAYLDAVEAVDGRLGRVLELVDSSRKLRRHLAIVLTSDHGGLGTSHSKADSRVNFTVPLMVWAKGVTRGADPYETNRSYADPGTTRPGYAASRQPIRNAVVANLSADLLDLPRVPGSQLNRTQNLLVFGD